MRDFPHHPLLDAEQEIALAGRIEAGVLARAVRTGQLPSPAGVTDAELAQLEREGEQAGQRFVLANLRLITLVSTRVPRVSGLSDDDLFQDGFCGLLTALQRWDHRRGVRFATYALPWIRSAVATTVASARTGGAAPQELRRHRTVQRAGAELTGLLGRDPTTAEIADRVGRSVAWVDRRLLAARTVSLDALGPGELAAVSPVDRASAGPFDQPGAESDAPDPAELLAVVPPALRSVIRLRYGLDGEPLTHEEIGRRLGVSAVTIRRLERRALQRLRESWRPDRAATGSGGAVA